jgi:hypothetical protein
MDPVSLVVGALAAGAQASVDKARKTTLTDTYVRLKQRVASGFAGNRPAEVALAEYEADPATWFAPLAKAVHDSGAADDTEVVSLAKRLMDLADPSGAKAGKYSVSVGTGKYSVSVGSSAGVVVGDHNTVTQTFDDVGAADLPAGGGSGNSPGSPVADDD